MVREFLNKVFELEFSTQTTSEVERLMIQIEKDETMDGMDIKSNLDVVSMLLSVDNQVKYEELEDELNELYDLTGLDIMEY